MTFTCAHCNFEFKTFLHLVLHLTATVAESLGDIAPLLPSGHPEHITAVSAHEMWGLRMPFEASKRCERIINDVPCRNDAEVFVRWECETCSMLLCSTCLLDVVRTNQDALRLGVSTIYQCPGGGTHDSAKFHQPVLI